MSGAGETGGDVSRDEAAWRDLIARFDLPADPALTSVPWPAREDLGGQPDASPDPPAPDRQTSTAEADRDGVADTVADQIITPDQLEGHRPVPPGVRPWARPSGGYIPADRTRVIRPAGDPRAYSPPEEDDDPYVPVPLPPPARLEPASKVALVGVLGGPGYLILSVFLHWTISATAAFVAVAAFIAGFATLVVKLGDRPRRDDDDDGAVL
jgi:hypothetical protein